MNKAFFLLLVLASSAYSSDLITLDVERSGLTSVILSLEGGGSSSVFIPQDSSNFRIVGGSYKIVNNTATISAGPSGFTTFSYSSSELTTKTSSSWKLFFTAPENSIVSVYMPAHAEILSSSPKPVKVSADDSRASLEFQGGQISLEYELKNLPEPEQSDSGLILPSVIILAMSIVIAAYLLRTKSHERQVSEKKPSLGLTSGKKEMMETFNENDKIIVDYLLSCEGKSKRNDLEKKTAISKSSLAKAINRLEKRKIIEIDRTSTTHFVKLSEYFLKL
ncbi:MAG: hypothetical protein ABH983_05345 [Candidatus Micrarchaeota archaeon]